MKQSKLCGYTSRNKKQGLIDSLLFYAVVPPPVVNAHEEEKRLRYASNDEGQPDEHRLLESDLQVDGHKGSRGHNAEHHY